MIELTENIVCRDTALTFMVPADHPMDDDLLSNIVNFKEMTVAFVQVIVGQGVDAPNDTDYTVKLLVSNIKDPNSFVPYDGPRFVDVGCNGIGWNLRTFGFIYARVSYSKGSVTSGKFKIVARAKKG